jgi:site-specific DNA recombinase
VPDPVRAPIVLMIFEDYCVKLLGLGEICDKLNRDLDRYPPPTRNRKDENDLPQTWARSQLYSMLRNPKYTGYNVWNRHDKRRGRPHLRRRDQWVWSATPVRLARAVRRGRRARPQERDPPPSERRARRLRAAQRPAQRPLLSAARPRAVRDVRAPSWRTRPPAPPARRPRPRRQRDAH